MLTSDRELNERLAKALGVDINDKSSAWYHKRRLPSGEITYLPRFSPAESVDALRKYVLPEIVRRGLQLAFCQAVVRGMMRKSADTDIEQVAMALFMVDVLTAPPAVLATAALEVLEATNAD